MGVNWRSFDLRARRINFDDSSKQEGTITEALARKESVAALL
jgi:hypothetical protein